MACNVSGLAVMPECTSLSLCFSLYRRRAYEDGDEQAEIEEQDEEAEEEVQVHVCLCVLHAFT